MSMTSKVTRKPSKARTVAAWRARQQRERERRVLAGARWLLVTWIVLCLCLGIAGLMAACQAAPGAARRDCVVVVDKRVGEQRAACVSQRELAEILQ